MGHFFKNNKMGKCYGLFSLMRINQPIGFFLLLWPTLWALWLSRCKMPEVYVLTMFIIAVFLMRSLGCVINDYIDKDLDCYIKRTSQRPLFSGFVSSLDVLILVFILLSMLFILILMLSISIRTILLSLVALMLTCVYPYTKRYIVFPQLFLGVTFGFSILIVFSFLNISLYTFLPIMLFFINVVWTMIYDTEYAMIDRDDDVLFGIKSTAVFFGNYERIFIGVLQLILLCLFVFVGLKINLGMIFYLALVGVAVLFIWQQILIFNRDRRKCYLAFLSNNYVGMLIFFGMIFDLSIL